MAPSAAMVSSPTCSFLNSTSMFRLKQQLLSLQLLLLLLLLLPSLLLLNPLRVQGHSPSPPLRFNPSTGQFKILQVADMHYANGASTPCLDILPGMLPCSDLNTTAFLRRVIAAEKPDLIAFTDTVRLQAEGDNVFGADCKDVAASQAAAFAPAIEAEIPWAAVLGNHDQEGGLSRRQLMERIVFMNYSRARVNPYPRRSSIDGFGNYNLEVYGIEGSSSADTSVLNLFFLDSGDYSPDPTVLGTYGWIKPSQQVWFSETSAKLKAEYRSASRSTQIATSAAAPGLAFFHIPLPEFAAFTNQSSMVGVKQEGISSPYWNSGFFLSMLQDGDVKAAFVGHDHKNDFCGDLAGVNLCYAGGFGYHAYGEVAWSRRARIIVASLQPAQINGSTDVGGRGVDEIRTWKRLDDNVFSKINEEILWHS